MAGATMGASPENPNYKEAQKMIHNCVYRWDVHRKIKLDALVDLIMRNLEGLGYHKLPRDKPPLLSCGEIDAIKYIYKRCGQTQHNTDAHKLIEAQREADIKHYEGNKR